MSNSPEAQPRSSTSSLLAAFPPSLNRGIIIGLGVALLVMPCHLFSIMASYSNGYYTQWSLVIVTTLTLVLIATALGAGFKGGVLLSVACIATTLFHVLTSEYLVALYLANQSLTQEGYAPLPLFVDPLTALDVFSFYSEGDSTLLTFVIIAITISAVLGVVTALTPATHMPQAVKVAAKTQMSDIPSEALSMGTPVQAHYTRTAALVGWGLVSCVGGLAMLIVILSQGWGLGGSIFFVLFSLLLLGVGGYRLYLALSNLDNQVLIFQDGISVAQGGRTAVLHWKDISAVWIDQYHFSVNAIPIVDRHKYTLDLRGGGKIVIDKTYKEMWDLGNAIQQGVAQFLLPMAIDALQRGKSLKFGAISIHKDTVTVNGNPYPSGRIETNTVQGHVTIQDRTVGRRGSTVGVSTIPNLHLCLSLLMILGSGQLPARSPMDGEAQA